VAGIVAKNLGREQSIVLAIDHSQSMHGRPLSDAVAAARVFVEEKPLPDRIAVVSFASQALNLSPLSSSTTDADGALVAISTDRVYGTALYDAVVLAAHELRAQGGIAGPGRDSGHRRAGDDEQVDPRPGD
jgi:hypothetical protein